MSKPYLYTEDLNKATAEYEISQLDCGLAHDLLVMTGERIEETGNALPPGSRYMAGFYAKRMPLPVTGGLEEDQDDGENSDRDDDDDDDCQVMPRKRSK